MSVFTDNAMVLVLRQDCMGNQKLLGTIAFTSHGDHDLINRRRGSFQDGVFHLTEFDP